MAAAASERQRTALGRCYLRRDDGCSNAIGTEIAESLPHFEEEEGSIAHIYFSPSGYVEKAFIILKPVTPETSALNNKSVVTLSK